MTAMISSVKEIGGPRGLNFLFISSKWLYSEREC